ncbi:anaerobic benzoate catabolism transcriptional regulator [compost metagenome]
MEPTQGAGVTRAVDEDEREDLKRTRHIDKPLGARLRALREDRGLTQAQMGQELGVSANQWGRHESGENRVPAARLWQFCKAMNVDVAVLYEGLPFQIMRDSDYSVAGMGEKDWGPALTGYPVKAAAPLVQRIGAVVRQLPEARQRTALAVVRALKLEQGD